MNSLNLPNTQTNKPTDKQLTERRQVLRDVVRIRWTHRKGSKKESV